MPGRPSMRSIFYHEEWESNGYDLRITSRSKNLNTDEVGTIREKEYLPDHLCPMKTSVSLEIELTDLFIM